MYSLVRHAEKEKGGLQTLCGEVVDRSIDLLSWNHVFILLLIHPLLRKRMKKEEEEGWGFWDLGNGREGGMEGREEKKGGERKRESSLRLSIGPVFC